MMNIRMIAAISIIAVVLSSCGGGSSDPAAQQSQIKEMLAKGFPMTPAQKADVGKLTAEGAAHLLAGKKEDASKSFDKALNILKLAADADTFNKSE